MIAALKALVGKLDVRRAPRCSCGYRDASTARPERATAVVHHDDYLVETEETPVATVEHYAPAVKWRCIDCGESWMYVYDWHTDQRVIFK